VRTGGQSYGLVLPDVTIQKKAKGETKLSQQEGIPELMAKARVAQRQIEGYSQEQVDKLVKATAKTVYDNAEILAKMAWEEGGMGVLEDKIFKTKNKARTIWNDLKDKKSVGIIDRDPAKGLLFIAKPMGVVGAVTPVTNPIVTDMSNAMYSIKSRNAVIIAPHPRSAKCGAYTVKLINEALKKLGAPENLVQIIEHPTLEMTTELMKAVDVSLATGGMAMVKSAYSSGKPSHGVGAGNVQCIMDRDIDIKDAVQKIVAGRTFDNGIICSGEQSVIAPADNYDAIIAEFVAQGAYFVSNADEKTAIRNTLFINGMINKDVVGQPVLKIAKLAGLNVPANTKLILVEADGIGEQDVLCKEKMCPFMVAFKYDTFEEAVNIAQTNLNYEGKGHSCALHSNSDAHIEYAGIALTISRLLVNQTCSGGAGGTFFNGLTPTTTLGCGSWGNNSDSENITYKHVLNVSRVAYLLKDVKVPTDEEIWAD
jgi:succinate-semialdehyde dehydrogenase